MITSARPQITHHTASIRGYLERRLIVVFLMGFASGLPLLLTGATLSIWLTQAGATLTTIGLFAFVGTPYTLKFLWAPLMDRAAVPVLSKQLGRRRSWMLVVQLILLLSIMGLGMSDPGSTPIVTAFLALMVAFFSASQDIVIDAYRIEILDDDQQGMGAAMTQAGYRFGLLTSGAGALYLADRLNWPVVYLLMASLVVVGMIVAWKAPVPMEAREAASASGSWLRNAVAEPFAEFFSRSTPAVAVTILCFILLYKFGDAFAGVMANPFYVRIGFSLVEIANASKIFGVFATLAGVFIGGLLVKRFGVLESLLVCGLFQMLSNLMFAAQAAIGPEIGFLYLTIGVENISGGMGSSAFVAYMSLLCNKAYTGTQFAMFTSLMAFGRTGLSTVSGWVADQTDWVLFFILSTFVALPGLFLLVWMMFRLPIQKQTQGSRHT